MTYFIKKTSIIIYLLLAGGSSFSQGFLTQKLDSAFTTLYEQNQFNGSVLIADKGKIVLSKGYGYRDISSKYSNTPETIYELASCSKQFTAAAVVILHRRGLLKYEDHIDWYIPELARWHEVTLYDLVRHTSGIPEYLADMSEAWDHKKIADNKDLISFYAARKDTLEFKPGSMYRYSNTNYALLASIIERVSGRAYADFLRTDLFVPLKMKSTFVYNRRQAPQTINRLATSYIWKRGSFEKITLDDPRYGDSLYYYLDGIVGNAKINSTVSDIYKWVNALTSNSFFSSSEFELMTVRIKTSKGRKIPYGFGLELSGDGDKLSFGHTGSWDGYATFIYHNMAKNRTIITLQNFNMGAYPFKTINQILDRKPIAIEYPKKITLPEDQISRFVGNYTSAEDGDVQTITFLNGHLVHNSKNIHWDLRFFPVSNHEFQGIRQGGADGVLKFVEMPNGDMKLEMLEDGKVVGVGLRKK